MAGMRAWRPAVRGSGFAVDAGVGDEAAAAACGMLDLKEA